MIPIFQIVNKCSCARHVSWRHRQPYWQQCMWFCNFITIIKVSGNRQREDTRNALSGREERKEAESSKIPISITDILNYITFPEEESWKWKSLKQQKTNSIAHIKLQLFGKRKVANGRVCNKERCILFKFYKSNFTNTNTYTCIQPYDNSFMIL